MEYDPIGIASITGEVPPPEEGVTFTVPYGERNFDITFSDQEMNTLLRAGFEKMLEGRGLPGFNFIVDLSDHDEPLHVLPRSIGINGKYDLETEPIDLKVDIISQNGGENEHRGILSARRSSWNHGAWSLIDYEIEPPLKGVAEERRRREIGQRIVEEHLDYINRRGQRRGEQRLSMGTRLGRLLSGRH